MSGILDSIFFTADLHLSHSNIIRFTKRPFDNVREMDEAILSNWNEVVPQNGEVYILGDLGFGSPFYIESIISKMYGKKYLIRGNHDKGSRIKKISHYFEWIKDYYELTVQTKESKLFLILSHYCHTVWNKSHYGSYHLWGHSHGKLNVPEYELSMDVGVDCHNFYPISLRDVEKEMEKRKLNKRGINTSIVEYNNFEKVGK
jgi:calcineurin-like phosphoesterase family protein